MELKYDFKQTSNAFSFTKPGFILIAVHISQGLWTSSVQLDTTNYAHRGAEYGRCDQCVITLLLTASLTRAVA